MTIARKEYAELEDFHNVYDYCSASTDNYRVAWDNDDSRMELVAPGALDYDNLLIVDPNGKGDYATIALALAAIATAADAAEDNLYCIMLLPGIYAEDVVLADYVSLSGQGWKATRINGKLTIGADCHVQHLWVYPDSPAIVAVEADVASGYTSYVSNCYFAINTTLDGTVTLVDHTGGGELRVDHSFLYCRNISDGASAKAVSVHLDAGYIQYAETHFKSSTKGTAILAHNEGEFSTNNIDLFNCSWSVHNDTAPVAAKNDGSGKIILGITYNNHTGTGYNGYSVSGSSIKILPMRADFFEAAEITAPAGVANSARIFAQDNGAGKTQLMAIFGSGAAQQLAIEP